MFKIGLGQDSHKLIAKSNKQEAISKKNLILGGVEISREYFLIADSDGDVIIHALCNALSSAIGEGSLDTWAGAMFKSGITDSKEFLQVIVTKIKQLGFSINNISIAIEAKKPRLESFREQMQKSLAKLIELKKEDIGITFTSGESLTAFGKGEAIQAFTTVLLSK